MTMSKNDIWTVIGVGMGGKGLLGALGIEGFRLRACDKDEAQIAGIRAAGGLHVEGRAKAFAPVELATTDLKAAVDGARVILVSTYGNDHPDVARALSPLLKDGQIIVLIQGHFGGTLVFRKALSESSCRAKVEVAEMDGYPYMMTVRAPDRVEFTTVKEFYQLVSVPASRSAAIVKEIGFAFPGLAAGPNLLQTGFNDLGGLFHAGGLVTNVGRAETGEHYHFYASNMTPSVCNLIEALDRERVAVAKAYSIDVPDVFKWLEITYNRKEASLHWSLQANAVTHYKYSPAPTSLKYRFLVTDVGCVLVPMAVLGGVAGIRMPVTDSVIRIAGALTKRDFFEEGRNLRNLGLENKSVAEILKAVTS
jgi:opine dehydrogenase